LTNFEIGERLLAEAEECYREMLDALDRRSWNLVIRRAQEVVELSLKAVLKAMGIEYPKRHDVGDVFKETCVRKGITFIRLSDLDEIEEISSYLARERSPAFYMERTYGEEEARKAKGDASKVFRLSKSLFEFLRSNG